MTQSIDLSGSTKSMWTKYWRRRLLVWGIIALVLFVGFLLTWNEFFVYVPAGQHLVIIAKDGDPLPPGFVLAEQGQKGILRAVQGEGWHFVMPIVYETQLEENTLIPPGKIGIMTARGGKPLAPGQVLAEEGQQGIQRRVLPPGMYRINRHGYEVELVDATDIRPGTVGVLRRRLGEPGTGRFAEKPNERGILRQVLQPGLYYINTKEFEVIRAQVGIFQTAFRDDLQNQDDTSITFISKGGFPISINSTVEWEVLPQDMPALVAEYGNRAVIERNVIDVQAHAIGRDKGINYGVQDFLEGSKREKFQDEYTSELTRVSRTKNVTVHSAFIRNILIPENYLRPIREKQISAETELTNRAKEATAQSEAEVEREQKLIDQRAAEVAADTEKLVAAIDREVENTTTRVKAEIEKVEAEFDAKIATLDAQRVQVVGEAKAKVTQLTETAKSSLFKLKLDAFGNNDDAFLRYTMAQDLNPDLRVRLFHAGPGTLWTNMDGKHINTFLPLGAPPETPKATKPATAPK
jgi:hypothetical protein